MDKKVLLKNLKEYFKNTEMHPCWGFLENLIKRIIEEYAKNDWKSCKVMLSRPKDNYFEDSFDDGIKILGYILNKIGVTGHENVCYSSDEGGSVYLGMKENVEA